MKPLAARAEIFKLCHLLGTDPAGFSFLRTVPPEQLRDLRLAVFEQRARHARRLVNVVAAVARHLPPWLCAVLAQHFIGPPLLAEVAGRLPAGFAARVAQHLSAAYLADICPHLDPRHARDLIQRLPVSRIVEVALLLIQRRDYPTLGRFVDVLRDEPIKAVLDAITDDEHLVRIAYFVESRSRLDHIVRMLPRERLRGIVLMVLDARRDVLLEVVSLVANVSYGLQRELGDLAAAQAENVLDTVIHTANTQGFWPDLLPVLGNLSEESLRKLVNLPILRAEPAVLNEILRTAEDEDLWGVLLPLVRLMQDSMVMQVSRLAALRPRAAIERACTAALTGEHWDVLMRVAANLPAAKQEECADIVKGYGRIDPELLRRVAALATQAGLGKWFAAGRGAV